MQSQIERAGLMKAMDREPVRSRLVLFKCAAGLAVIALVAVIGLAAPINAATPIAQSPKAAAAAEARANMRAQPHRKQVFDERRARFAGGTDRTVASKGVEPSNRLPLALR